MAVPGSINMSVTLILLLLALQLYQAIARLEITVSCLAYVRLVSTSIGEAGSIGKAGSEAMDFLNRNPNVDEDDRRRILMPLTALFGGMTPPHDANEHEWEEQMLSRLSTIQGMYWR